MNAAAGAAARGPFAYLLQTQTGQWLVLGLGAFSVFPDKCEEIVRPILRSLILGFPNVPYAANLVKATAGNEQHSQTQSPIVIQTSSGNSASDKIWGQLIGYTVSAAGVWVSYTVAIHYLPDWAKEMLPVTRQVFDKAVTNLSKGILDLSEKILTLGRKQDETHGELLEAREDIHNIQSAVDRCEDSLENAERVNGRTARGIKLLVRAVATMVPGNLNIAEELNVFAREIDIDPKERGEYIDAQQKNARDMNMFQSPSQDSHNQSQTNNNERKMLITPKTPTTRSISSGSDEISEISADGPRGTMIMQHRTNDYGDVSLLGSTMYSPTPNMGVRSVNASKRAGLTASGINIQNRIDALLNHGKVM